MDSGRFDMAICISGIDCGLDYFYPCFDCGYNPETGRLYVHLLEYPLNQVRLPGYNGKVKYAQFLHDASELQFANPRGDDEAGDDIILRLPVIKPPVEIPVIELMLY